MNPARRWISLVCVGTLLCLGCPASSADNEASVVRAPPSPNSLFERMGGEPVVTGVANDLIDRVLADARLKRSFDGSNIPRIKHLLAEQICALAGGGCTYTGDSMREVHAGHHISEAEFFGMVADLRVSLIAHRVALRERNELLALLAPMKRDVVEIPGAKSAPER